MGSSSAVLVSSPIFLDATQFATTSDACAAINAAIVQMNTTTKNGVVDARGFTGPLKCASNMFPSNATGKLLLGNVVLNVSVTQVQPSKFQVEGTGWAISGTPSNTVIQACAAVTLLCPNVLAGVGMLPPVLWCWGHGGGCSNAGNPGISFGSLTQFMSFDCSAVTNCVDMQAFYVQEGSGCWHCQFHGWYNSGVGLDICGGFKGACQNSSFMDLFAGVEVMGTVCEASNVFHQHWIG